jgi:hypothetical protein
MLNLTKEAIYWGESIVAQQHPELIKGRAYTLKISEVQSCFAITPINRVDLENDQIVVRGNLGIPQQRYTSDNDLVKDWALAEWPYDWSTLRESGGKTQPLLPTS